MGQQPSSCASSPSSGPWWGRPPPPRPSCVYDAPPPFARPPPPPPRASPPGHLARLRRDVRWLWFRYAVDHPLVHPGTGARVFLLGTEHSDSVLALYVRELVRLVRPHVVAVEQDEDAHPDGARRACRHLADLPYDDDDDGGGGGGAGRPAWAPKVLTSFRKAVVANTGRLLLTGLPPTVYFKMLLSGTRPIGWEVWSGVGAADEVSAEVVSLDVPAVRHQELRTRHNADARWSDASLVRLWIRRHAEASGMNEGDYYRRPLPRLWPGLCFPALSLAQRCYDPEQTERAHLVDKELGTPWHQHLVVPRDAHMFERLWHVASGTDRAGARVPEGEQLKVVAVVGRGHVPGIRKLWADRAAKCGKVDSGWEEAGREGNGDGWEKGRASLRPVCRIFSPGRRSVPISSPFCLEQTPPGQAPRKPQFLAFGVSRHFKL